MHMAYPYLAVAKIHATAALFFITVREEPDTVVMLYQYVSLYNQIFLVIFCLKS